jgi:ribokinase
MSTPSQPVIVVVGSLHYDIMVDAPDRPRKGETVAGHAWRPKFGGKGGNQAIAAARAGARVRMAGAVGDDEFGRFLLERLAAGSVDRDHVATLPGTGSGMSVAISDAGGDYGAVIVSGANLSIDPQAVADAGLWRDARALILQNEVPEAVNVSAARAAKATEAIVCLNAAPVRAMSSELASLVDVLVVNAVEAEDMCGIAVDDLPSALAAGRRASCASRTPRHPGQHPRCR